MTDEQKEAVEWLRASIEESNPQGMWTRRAHTILALLAEPRLPRPEDVPTHVLDAMDMARLDSKGGCVTSLRDGYRALYDHYTAPRTKTVSVWRLEFAYKKPPEGPWVPRSVGYETKAEAEQKAKDLAEVFFHACIRVTGPHQQEVPADDAR